MQLSIGTCLHGGTYKIEKVLGQGSFGITYLAEHTLLNKKVAIKEFFMRELNTRGEDGSITGITSSSLSHNYGLKFKKEAINLSRLEHPNIVRVTDSFEENGTYYYVMDYIEGCNLNDYLKTNSLSQEEAFDIIIDVAKALIYMHEEKKVLHLDLKPGNIMRRSNDGHIILIDFGLSKHFSNEGQPETSTTIGLGTAGYAPIEQSNQAKNGEFRPTIDVYALGATFYKLLTGETPPNASDLVSDNELLRASLEQHHVSSTIISIIENAMMPSVKKRTQSIRDFMVSVTAAKNEASFHDDTSVSLDHISNEVEDSVKTDTTTEDEETQILGPLPEENIEEPSQEKIEEKQEPSFNLPPTNNSQEEEKEVHQYKQLEEKPERDRTLLYFFSISALIIFAFICIKCIRDKTMEEVVEEPDYNFILAESETDWYLSNDGGIYCFLDDDVYYTKRCDIPDGFRNLHYEEEDSIEMYSGNFEDGRMTNGKITYRNGDYFEGDFFYDGTWDKGTGRKTQSDGATYEGHFERGLYNGEGTYIEGNYTYKGHFVDGEYDGYGRQEWSDAKDNESCAFEGQFSKGVRNGTGIYYYPDHRYEKVKIKNNVIQDYLEYGNW